MVYWGKEISAELSPALGLFNDKSPVRSPFPSMNWCLFPGVRLEAIVHQLETTERTRVWTAGPAAPGLLLTHSSVILKKNFNVIQFIHHMGNDDTCLLVIEIKFRW